MNGLHKKIESKDITINKIEKKTFFNVFFLNFKNIKIQENIEIVKSWTNERYHKHK